jgi:membrane protein YqaA with SNARE-associated domain
VRLLFWELVTQASDWMQQFAVQYQYAGVFLLALIGASSIFIPIPYTTVIFYLGGHGFDPIFLALAAGFGSAIGEFSGYLLGVYGAKIISKKRRQKMEFMVKVFNSWGPLAIFVFALTPLPDDLLFIPLGMMHYRIVKAFIPALAGKISMNFIVAYGGRVTNDTIKIFFGGSEGDLIATVLTAVIAIVLLVIVLVVMFKLDWEKIYYKYVEKGEKKKDESNR